MPHPPFTPDQKKEIEQIIAAALKNKEQAGLWGWIQRIFPKDPLPLALCFLALHFNSFDDLYHHCEDLVECAPVVISDAGYVADYAYDRLRHGVEVPAAPDGGGYYANLSSTGTYTMSLRLPAGSSSITGGFISNIAQVDVVSIDSDGNLKITKKPLA